MQHARATRTMILLSGLMALAAVGLLLPGCEKSMQSPSPLSSNPTASPVNGALAKESAQTAQSVMIDIQGAGDFIIESDQTWQFDKACGANYFSASGGTATQQANAKENFSHQQRCKFWNGSGDLVGGTQGPVTVTVASQPTTAKTCWTLHSSSSGDNVDVGVNITIAGESFLLNKQFSPNGKYSFTLKNSDGSSRIANLAVTLSGDASQVDNPGHTIVDGDATNNNCLLAFEYTGNAGTNGTAQTHLQDGTMGDILNSDSTPKNDGGCGTTSIANVDPISYNLGVGSYTITVSGTVKGVDGNANLAFSGTAQVTISAQGCE